jgi:hypothetical protein
VDRDVLRDRLETLALPHRWEGPALVVSSDDEAWAERVMDQVEADLDDAREAADGAQVGYDLTEWDDDSCTRLMDMLESESIAYRIDGDEIFVEGADEERVDELVTVILDPDAVVTAPEGGGDVMSEMFVAADRLRHDPDDHAGAKALAEAASRAETQGPPYGMDPKWWAGIVEQAEQIAGILAAPVSEDEHVRELADGLRDALRPYV